MTKDTRSLPTLDQNDVDFLTGPSNPTNLYRDYWSRGPSDVNFANPVVGQFVQSPKELSVSSSTPTRADYVVLCSLARTLSDGLAIRLTARSMTLAGESRPPVAYRLGWTGANADSDWAKYSKKLDDLDALAEGWNGYSAPAPSDDAIAPARDFLNALRRRRLLPTRVAASAVGGVGITIRRATRKVYVEFLNDGSISALFADDKNQSLSTQAVVNSLVGFDTVISAAEDYLDG